MRYSIFTIIFIMMLGGRTYGSVGEIIDCKGKSFYSDIFLKAKCIKFVNHTIRNIYLYDVQTDPTQYTADRGDEVQVNGHWIELPAGESRNLASQIYLDGSDFPYHLHYVAISMGGEYRWFSGGKTVCVDLNMQKNTINPSKTDYYYSHEKICASYNIHYAMSGPHVFKDSDAKRYVKYQSNSIISPPDEKEKVDYKQLTKEELAKLELLEKQTAACNAITEELHKDLSAIKKDETFRYNVNLCSEDLLKLLEESDIEVEKLDAVVEKLRQNLEKDHIPTIKGKLKALDVNNAPDQINALGIDVLYKGESFKIFDSTVPGFYATVGRSYRYEHLEIFNVRNDQTSFRVAELAFAETFEWYPRQFKQEVTTSEEKFDYIDGLTNTIKYLATANISFENDFGYSEDSPVPLAVQVGLREYIISKAEFYSKGISLEEKLKKLDKDSLTEQQQYALELVKVSIHVVKRFDSSAISESYNSFANDVNRLLEKAGIALSQAVCQIGSLIFSDVADTLSMMKGYDICTGEKINMVDGVFYGLGLVIGTAPMWKGLADFFSSHEYLGKFAKRVFGETASIKEKLAKNFDMTNPSEVEQFVRIIGKPCQLITSLDPEKSLLWTFENFLFPKAYASVNDGMDDCLSEAIDGFVISAMEKFGSSEGLKNFMDIVKSDLPAGARLDKIIKEMNYPKLWTDVKKKTSVQNAYRHYKDHGREFPSINNAVEYVEAAHSFMTLPPAGTLRKVRAKNGDQLFYHEATNTFAVSTKDGVPRTMFKPDLGIEYWNKQI